MVIVPFVLEASIIEHLWIKFFCIWKLMGKKIYTEITLNQIENMYECTY
jgi:hypothetical protein